MNGHGGSRSQIRSDWQRDWPWRVDEAGPGGLDSWGEGRRKKGKGAGPRHTENLSAMLQVWARRKGPGTCRRPLLSSLHPPTRQQRSKCLTLSQVKRRLSAPWRGENKSHLMIRQMLRLSDSNIETHLANNSLLGKSSWPLNNAVVKGIAQSEIPMCNS